MINRIRAIRKEKGWTLAQLAEACEPSTTAQTIGRLETGTRTLSIDWMRRIGAALGIDPQMLVRSETADAVQLVARLTDGGAQALTTPRDVLAPSDLAGDTPMMAMTIEVAVGPYQAGDQLWLERFAPEDAARAVNRDVLVPRKGGRFAFGRLVDRSGARLAILPLRAGEKQQVVTDPEWLGVAAMLVRRL